MRLTRGLLTQYTLKDFRDLLAESKDLIVITGAGISAESGIPTYRRDSDLKFSIKQIEKLASKKTFDEDPASVWEFYHYRRELVMKAKPNAAHEALVKCEKWFFETGRKFTLVTTNVDGLHQRAGSENVIEMHGSLFKTRCTKCKKVEVNFDSPICEALKGKEKLFNETFDKSDIPVKDLPHCKDCGGLLRPNVIWFFEHLNKTISDYGWKIIKKCDLAAVIGFSSMVFPVALYGTTIAERGVPVAEFSTRKGPYTDSFRYFYKGNATHFVPRAFDKDYVEKAAEKESYEFDPNKGTQFDDLPRISTLSESSSFEPISKSKFKYKVDGISAEKEKGISMLETSESVLY